MTEKPKSKDGQKFLIILLGFFIVMCCANAVFVYFALTTYAGTVTERPYEKGLDYNNVIAASAAQKNSDILSDYNYGDGHYAVILQTKEGKPIDNAIVKAKIIRAIKSGSDFDIDLVHKGSGRYETPINPPHAGLWIAKTKIDWDKQTFFRSDKMIVKK